MSGVFVEGLTPDNVKVRNHHVSLERLQEQEKTAGGISLPSNMGEKNMACKIMDTGSGIKLRRHTKVTAPGVAPFKRLDEIVVPTLRFCQVGDIVAVRQFEGQRTHPINRNFVISDGRLVIGRYAAKPWPRPDSASNQTGG